LNTYDGSVEMWYLGGKGGVFSGRKGREKAKVGEKILPS